MGIKDDWAACRKKLAFTAGADGSATEGDKASSAARVERVRSHASLDVDGANVAPLATTGATSAGNGAEPAVDDRAHEYEQLLAANNDFKLPGIASDRYALLAAHQQQGKDATEAIERTALVFDEDDYEIRDTIAAMKELGFAVEEASELEQAISLYERKRHSFDVVIIGLRGPAFMTLRFLESVAPVKVPVILTLGAQAIAPRDAGLAGGGGSGCGSSGAGSGPAEPEPSAEMARATELALELGANCFMSKPLDRKRLQERLSQLMARFGSAAAEYRRMLDITDPAYSVKTAKNMVLQEIASSESRKTTVALTPTAFYFARKVELAPKDTIDMGLMTGRKSKFAIALKRSKAAQHARVRVQQASLRRRLETKFSMKTVEPRKSRAKSKTRGRASTAARKAVFGGPVAPADVLSSDAPDSTFRRMMDGCNTGSGKMALSVITSLAQKKNRAEGSLPVLKDFKGNLSFITLPWEEARQRRRTEEYGKAPRQQARDILQAEFREDVPTSKCATSGQRLLQKGYEMKCRGDFVSAIRAYTRATVADHRYAAAYLCRGVTHHLLGHNNDAINDFAECLRLDPKSVSARFNRALIFAHDSLDDEALDELDEAIRINPKDAELFGFRAFINRRRGDFFKAQADYQSKVNLLKAEEEAREAERQERARHKAERLKGILGRSGSHRSKGAGGGSGDGGGGGDDDDNNDDDDDDDAHKRFVSGGSTDERVEIAGGVGLDTAKGTAEDDEAASQSEQGVETKKKWDTNYDGRVDLAEFTAATQHFDSVYAELFQQKSALELSCDKAPIHRTPEDLERIERALLEINIFRRMPQRKVRELCREIRLANVLPGDYVVQQGAEAHNFFAILEGRLNVTISFSEYDAEQVVNRMSQGTHFGENGLINGTVRQVNIVVDPDSDAALIFVISRELFFRTELDLVLRADREELKRTLRHAMIFDDLPKDAFNDFCMIVRRVSYRHNQVILRQGEAASRFCILIKGICKTLKYTDPGAELLKRKKQLEDQLGQFEMSYAVHHGNVNNSNAVRRADRALALNEKRRQELAKVDAKLEALRRDANGTYKDRKGKLVATSTVYPGNILGEEALLDPYQGREQYTVVADTYVTLMVVHKDQLQSYKQSELLVQKVRRKKLLL